ADGALEIEQHRIVRAPLVGVERLPSAGHQGRGESGPGEDAANPLGLLPLGLQDQDPLLVRRGLHAADSIEDGAMSANMAEFCLDTLESRGAAAVVIPSFPL